MERRFSKIHSPGAFVNSNEGLDRLDDIAMRFIVFGKNIKKLIKSPRENCWQVILRISHSTVLDPGAVMGYRSVIGYFTQMIMKDLLLLSGYDVLYGKVKEFIRNHLFDRQIEIDDLNTL